MDSAQAPGIRRFVSNAAILAAIVALSWYGLRPPSPKGLNAPPTEFSAERALQVLGRVLANGMPHPVGSASDDAVRSRILQELTALGYDPQVQNAFDCNDGSCATVNNVLVRIEGSDAALAGQAVVLSSHYDSVAAGPGASDDGTGVAATIEVARALRSLPKPRHPIILLIDEGEEAGLLGARAFMDWHPWAKEVRAVVNVDSRGASGASLMFETGTANQWTIGLFQRAVARPETSSVFYSVYQLLPNDTDMTVFKAFGKQGVNFAFIGDEPQYHTPHDDVANVDAGTLQHQGENVLAMTLAFANDDIANPPESEAVFFEVFGRHVFVWPQMRALPLGTIAALLLAGEIAWLFHMRRLNSSQFVSGVTAWFMSLVTTAALALILQNVFRLIGAIPVDWIAHSLPVRMTFWLLALSLVIVHGIAFARRAGFWGLWTGVWMCWGVLGILLGWLLPGMSYVMQLPALTAALAGLPVVLWRQESSVRQWLAGVLPMAVAAIPSFAPLMLIYVAVGNRILTVLAILVALFLSPLIPLCVDLSGAEGLIALSIPATPVLATGLAAFVAAIIPAYSAQAPERVNLQFWQNGDSGKAQWMVEPASGRLPESIRLAGAFHSARTGEVPWARGAAFLADAPAVEGGAPTFTVQDSSIEGERRRFVALLRSERSAPAATVMFPPDSGIEDVHVENVSVPPELTRMRSYFNGWFVFSCPAMPAKGIEISFLLPMGKPVTATVVDHSYGLPDDGKFLINARPLVATPSGEGDVTVISRRVQLNP